MASCIGCHAAKGAKATCDTCHAIMSRNGPRPGYNHTSPFDADQRLLARLNSPSPSAQNPESPQNSQSTQSSQGTQSSQSGNRSHSASAALALASVLHAPLL